MTTTTRELSGFYRQCQHCQAPLVSPFPTNWRLAGVVDPPGTTPRRVWFTPHRPECPR